MKLSLLLSTIAVPVALADFTVFFIHHTLGGDDLFRWAVHDDTPTNWEQYDAKRTYRSSNDVSGGKIGVRCWGSGCTENKVSGIDGLEMHFSNDPLYHFTLYKDRGYEMTGLDGRKYGDCEVSTGNDFDVSEGNNRVRGYRKFYCRTPITAWHINEYEKP